MTSWMAALKEQKLKVKSARDALQVKGYLDSGNYGLNWAVSGRLLRGYPLGHTLEVFGDPGTGKSFLAARAIAMVQSLGGVALLDDIEGAYNLEHMEQHLGIDVKELAMTDPRSRTVNDHLKATQAFLKAYVASKQKGPGLAVLDSLAQLSTEHEMEVQLEKRDMSKAGDLKAFYRLIGGDVFDLPVLHFATNHTIANVGNMYNPRTTPGGGGPKFTATVRVDLRTVSKIKAGVDYIGVICTAFIEKNRIAPPWKRVQLAIPFGEPISRTSGLVQLLTGLGVLKERGQFLFYGGKKVGRAYGDNKARFLDSDVVGAELAEQHPKIFEETDAALEAGQLESPKAAVEAGGE